MQNYQREFIDFLVHSRALRFGEFTLKSGRKSPYFFNAGEFNHGAQIWRLGYYYASAIREITTKPTVIFGPAYKGISLCIAAAIAFKSEFGQDVAFCFDRKEVKDHGEGGWLVGYVPQKDDRIVLVDDVITDGATKIESIQRLRGFASGTVTGLVIALDRKEKNSEGVNSVESVAERTGVEVRAIISIYDILEYLPGREIDGKVVLTVGIKFQIENYLAEYGV